MSGYIRTVEIKVPFDGGEARVVLAPLKRAHLLQLQALLPRGSEADTVVLDNRAVDAFSMYSEMLRKEYVKEYDVQDAGKNQVPLEEWTDNAYFSSLVGQIMIKHLQSAVPGNPS